MPDILWLSLLTLEDLLLFFARHDCKLRIFGFWTFWTLVEQNKTSEDVTLGQLGSFSTISLS